MRGRWMIIPDWPPLYAGAATALTQSPVTGTALSLGIIPVTVTATDEASNTNSCTFNVTLSSQANPVITCPGSQAVVQT
ncbi:MAG: HYR domain-containing protein [Saprospiraceae bacterium]